MPSQKAKDHYLGRGKEGRFNCAQAIIKAFQEKFQLDDKLVKLFSSHGGGNAPGNVCGAYFAACHIIKQHHPNKLTDFQTFFLSHAGSVKCQEIRGQKKLSCLGCIEKSAEYVNKL
ncbi:MAG: C-GCAxxG-C-C family (seleno)protein [bacterium]